MRSLDVSAFDPVGVNQNKLRFLEAFAAFCVLRESRRSRPRSRTNSTATMRSSRAKAAGPASMLRRDGRDVSLRDWAAEIVDSMRGVCELLDEGDPQRPYRARSSCRRRRCATSR